jgi:hypothetical protein
MDDSVGESSVSFKMLLHLFPYELCVGLMTVCARMGVDLGALFRHDPASRYGSALDGNGGQP